VPFSCIWVPAQRGYDFTNEFLMMKQMCDGESNRNADDASARDPQGSRLLIPDVVDDDE
jgi:hypothetical protein